MNDRKYEFNPETMEFQSKSKQRSFWISMAAVCIGAILFLPVIFLIYSYTLQMQYERSNNSEYKVLKKQYKLLMSRKLRIDEYLQEVIQKDKDIYKAVFNTEPDNSAFKKKNPYVDFIEKGESFIVEDNTKRLKRIKAVLMNNQKIAREILTKTDSAQALAYRSLPGIQPLYNISASYPVYGFGNKIDYLYKSMFFHPGIDYSAPENTKVFATGDGKVKLAGEAREQGKRVIIDHGNGYTTMYSHLHSILTAAGKKVNRGDCIGTVGSTGKSSIPHLHYEIRYKGKAVNPVSYFYLDLNPDTYAAITLAAHRSGLSLD